MLFETYGFTYFDFTNPVNLGVTDDEMIDSIHGSEYVTLLIYIQMLENSPDVLGQYSDLEYLERIAGGVNNPFEIFGNQF